MDLIFGNLKAKLDGTIVIKVYAREPEEIADFAMLEAAEHWHAAKLVLTAL